MIAPSVSYQRILSSVISVFASSATAAGLMALASIWIIQNTNAEAFAAYTLGLSACYFSYRVFTIPIIHIYLIEDDRRSAQASIWSILTAAIASSAVISSIVSIFLFGPTHLAWAVITLSVAFSAFDILRGALQYAHRFHAYGFVDIGRAAVFTVGVLSLSFEDALTAEHIIMAQAAATVLATTIMWRGATMGESPNRTIRTIFSALSQTLSPAYANLFSYFMLIALLGQIEVFFLNALSDTFELATYGAALRFYQILVLVLGAVMAVFLPIIQQVESTSQLKEIYSGHIRLSLLFSVICFHVAMAGEQWLPYMGAARYPDSPIVFMILSASAMTSFLCAPFVSHCMKLRDFRFLTCAAATSLTASIAIGIIAVPILGAPGAAFCLFIGNATLTIRLFLRSWKKFQ